MGRNRSPKKRVQKYHGKTLEDILSGAPDKVDIEVDGVMQSVPLFNNKIPTSHAYNFDVGVRTEQFKFDTSKENILDIKERNKKEKLRRHRIAKAENEGMFESWAKGLLEQVKIIKKEVKDLYDNDTAFKNADPMDRFTHLATKYQGFSNQHPIVLQKIAIDGVYSDKAFKKYLKKCFEYRQQVSRQEIKPESNRDEHFKRQADYARFLYMQSKGWNPKEAARTWSAIYKAFKTEDKEFKEKEEKVKAELEEDDLKYLDELRKELIHNIKSNSNEFLDLLNKCANTPGNVVHEDTESEDDFEYGDIKQIPGRYDDAWSDNE